MYKCGNYVLPETDEADDCYYKDDRCCYYCDREQQCKAESKCKFDCYDDDNNNKDDVNAYWEENKE